MAAMSENVPAGCDGSEEVFDMVCTPCSKKGGGQVQGICYCVDCRETFCKTCADFHARFSAMASHKVVAGKDKPDDIKADVRPSASLPRCSQHDDQKVTMFCKDHDVVGCSVCVALNHRACKDVHYIPTVASGIKSSVELQNMKREISETRKLVEESNISAEAVLSECEESKTSNAEAVELFRDSLVKRIEELEKIGQKQLQERFTMVKGKAEKQVVDLRTLLSDLELKESRLQRIDDADDSQIFIDVKQGGNVVQAAQSKVQNMNLQSNKVRFMPSLNIEECIRQQDSLGRLVEVTSFNVKATDDTSNCDITDICQLPDGTILLADHNNFCVKRFDMFFKLIDKCLVFYAPECMCFVKTSGQNHLIAVTLGTMSKVQLLEIGKTFVSKSTISTGDFCNGVTFNDGALYVICIPSDQPSRVLVFNLDGKLLRRLTFDERSIQLSSPSKIVYNGTGNKLYIADMRIGMVCLSLDGRILGPGNRDLRPAMGVCNGPDGQVFVCGMNKRVVSVVEAKDNTGRATTLLTNDCGLKSVQSICFDERYHGSTGASRIVLSLTGFVNDVYSVVVG